MNCFFCKIDLESSSAITLDKKNSFNNTVFEQGSFRCMKCKEVYSCIQCKQMMTKHYKDCKSIPKPIIHFNQGNHDLIKFNYIHIPKELGGGCGDIKSVTYFNEGNKMIIFHNCKYALFDANGKYGWMEYNKSMEECQLKQTIGENICDTIVKELFPDNEFIPNKKLGLKLYCRELNIAIEYRGKHFFEYIEDYHVQEINYINQCKQNEITQEICNKKNIKLIFIPYTCKTIVEMKEQIMKYIV